MTRFRRLRNNTSVRNLVRETSLTANDVIQPFFIIEGNNKQESIESMPGIQRYSIDLLIRLVIIDSSSADKLTLFLSNFILVIVIGIDIVLANPSTSSRLAEP